MKSAALIESNSRVLDSAHRGRAWYLQQQCNLPDGIAAQGFDHARTNDVELIVGLFLAHDLAIRSIRAGISGPTLYVRWRYHFALELCALVPKLAQTAMDSLSSLS